MSNVLQLAETEKPFQIQTRLIPARYQISEDQLCNFVKNPTIAAEYFFKGNNDNPGKRFLDEFQKIRLKQYVLVPRVMDSSGYSSFKSTTFWMAFVLRCLLIPEHVCGVFYQNFNNGQQIFWPNFDKYLRQSEIFGKYVGKMAIDYSEVENKKGASRGPSCWSYHFRNGSKLLMPAPGFVADARNIAGMRFHDMGIDEFTKIEQAGSEGIGQQLIGRCTIESFNENHPFWCNHHLFLATAENTSHPSFKRYSNYLREVRNGNPEYSVISFSYKDMSHLPSASGKAFNIALRNSKNIKDLIADSSKSRFLQEGLGIWSHHGRGWYEGEDLEKCVQRGRERNLVPLTCREDDPSKSEKVFFFLGSDPAKSEKAKSDDGALVLLRAEPTIEEPGDDIRNWRLDYVWAYKVRKADTTQWASLIHLKNKHFDFSGVCLDHGGGGQWIKDELAKETQIIYDHATRVVPIVLPDNHNVIHAKFILIMFSHGDDSIRQRWEGAKTADTLTDIAHCEMHEAISRGLLGFPCPFEEVPQAVRETWSDEKQWSNRLLDLTRKQLSMINVKTNEDGTFFTKNGARQFEAKGRKDFAYAAMHAYIRFLVWLKLDHYGFTPKEEEAGGGE